MENQTYDRVNLTELKSLRSDSMRPDRSAWHIRWFIIPLSMILCVIQVAITISIEHLVAGGPQVTSTLIPVIGFATLMVLVLVVNPLLRLAFRGVVLPPLGRAELISVFSTLLVTAGISTFGLANQLIPIISGPWNPDWNTRQRQWDQKALRYLNPALYLVVPDNAPDAERAKAVAQLRHLEKKLLEAQRGRLRIAEQLLQRTRQTIERIGLFDKLEIEGQLDQVIFEFEDREITAADGAGTSAGRGPDSRETIKMAVGTVRRLLASDTEVFQPSELQRAIAVLRGHMAQQSPQRNEQFSHAAAAIGRRLSWNAVRLLQRIISEGQVADAARLDSANKVLHDFLLEDDPDLAEQLQLALPIANDILKQGLAFGAIEQVIRGIYIDRKQLDAAFEMVRAQLNQADVSGVGQLEQARPTVDRCFEHNAAARVITEFRIGVSLNKPPEGESWNAWWRYYKSIFGKIPWSSWLKPLGCWLIFIFACYGAFYCLTYVVLDYWTRRDKLVFPLAKLPESMVPQEGERSWIPRSFCTMGLWLGFAVSFLILSYNAMSMAGWLPGLTGIRLGFDIENVVKDTVFEGLIGYATQKTYFLIIFTAIGISFLLSTGVSFSIWFYLLVGKLMILSATWMGYGRTGADFPADWLGRTNAPTSLGAGGIMLYSAISLWRCLSGYKQLAREKSSGENRRVPLPAIGLLVSMAIMTLWLWWNGQWHPKTLGLVVVFVCFLMLLTFGLMRVVAESGVYWIQNHGSFFHFYKALGAGKVISATLVGPLIMIYSVLFLDLKTFIAPNLLNAARMRNDVSASRLRFHANIIICIVVSVAAALTLLIVIGYARGANHMGGWFFRDYPILMVEEMGSIIASDPEFRGGDVAWYSAGAGWVAMTLWIRKSIFWFPHPVGFIMLINPLISSIWFSFFLGWLAKYLVVKYGGKVTFDKVRLIFVGLILGEIIAVLAWGLVSVLAGVRIGSALTMNRYGTGP